MADEPNTIVESAPVELVNPAIDTGRESDTETEIDEVTDPDDEGEAEADEDGEQTGGDDDAEGDGLDPEPDAAAVDDDLEDVEIDGKSYKVHKDLKDNFLMHQDYTKKTQEIAEVRRTLDVARQITVTELQAQSKIAQIDQTLKEYENVDWAAYEQQDPLAANSAWRQLQQLEKQKQAEISTLTKAQQARTVAAQQDFAKRLEATQDYARKKIKGWTPQLGSELLKFAKASGISQEGIRNSLSPEFYGFLHKAYLGEQMLKRQSQPKKQQTTPKPLETVKGKSSVRAHKSLGTMEMDEYAAARKAGRVR